MIASQPRSASQIASRDGGRRGDHLRAGCLDAGDQRLRRQAEMEADDLGAQFLDHVAERVVERRPFDTGIGVGGVDAELGIVGREPLPPRRFAPFVMARAGVWQKKFMLTGAFVRWPDASPISARACSWLSMAHGSEPSPPALATAIVMLGRARARPSAPG